jgi:hypothetical protein
LVNVQLAESNGLQVPSRTEVMEKKNEIHKALSFVYSAETVKQLIQEKKSSSLRPANVAVEKGRLRNELVVARARNDEGEADRILICLKHLEQVNPSLQLICTNNARMHHASLHIRKQNSESPFTSAGLHFF